MFISIIRKYEKVSRNSKSRLFLIWDDWDDYHFKTLFGVIYFDEHGQEFDLDFVKIAFYGQAEGEKKLKIGDTFDSLPSENFSLGTPSYYEKLNSLGTLIRDKILDTLKDIAKNQAIFTKAINERVTQISLLRSVSITEVTGQFRRMTGGGALLTPFDFYFKTKIKESQDQIRLDFKVIPNSNPPSNISVLIGRNGSGKTTIINKIINTLLGKDTESEITEILSRIASIEASRNTLFEKKVIFPVVINISFSAFDDSVVQVGNNIIDNEIRYSYIGLRKNTHDIEGIFLKTPSDLKFEFFDSLNNCKKKMIHDRWQKAISILESDTNFKDENISSLIIEDETLDENERSSAYRDKAISIFSKLSSGHKIVLLTITRLVELLEEKTLVLIDEPETHLHPPLLSAFIRSLSELLIHRNGVAIIATHSPVILQEVPKSCIWKLNRSGNIVESSRLKIESFGENVGTLTHEVFSLEVTNSGFHKSLKDVVETTNSYEEALEKYDDNLGLEAKAILRSLFYQKQTNNDTNI